MFEQYMDSVRREEIAYPKLFASYAEREYGILYYMEDNRDSSRLFTGRWAGVRCSTTLLRRTISAAMRGFCRLTAIPIPPKSPIG